jgi:deoxyribonuclease-4
MNPRSASSPKDELLVGAHVPVAGGLHRAPGHADVIGASAMQIFTRNQLQWSAKPVGQREAAGFRAALRASGVRAVVAHGSYLVNLASPSTRLRRRSTAAVLAELRRCHALGIPLAVFHPGAHMGAGEQAGIAAVAASVDEVLSRAEGLAVILLLEVTAGQGSTLGHRFEQLAAVMDRLRAPQRVGICLDTCHMTAAGYDLVTPAGYQGTIDELDRTLGLARVRAIHLNDARAPRGSRLDRHAPIGTGHLGLRTFRRLDNDTRFRAVPMLMETPGPAEKWRREVALLRSLLR